MKSNSILVPLFVLIIIAGCGGGGGVSSRPAQLVSINLSPLNQSIASGMLEAFTLTGKYSDNTVKVLTTSAVWTSSTPGVATINKSTGVATSVAPGVTTITVSYGGFSPQSTTLTVTQAALVSIAVEPALSSIAVGTTEQFTATGTYTDNTTQNLTTSATWISSAPAVALVSNVTGSNGLVTSLASGSTLIIAKLGSVSGSTTLTVTGASTAIADNVVPITVNGSLCNSGTSLSYFNKPCVSVKVCVPSTPTTCDTITDILLDTGSFGLRVFKSALPNTFSSLSPVTAGSGQLAECVTFGDGSTEWGPVQLADVVLGNETAQHIPIHVIDSTFGTVQNCGTPDQSPSAAGFNGILGVGVFREDCGSGCVSISNNGIYYSCNNSVCSATSVALANQVQNPVASLPQDNNGVIVELPSVSLNGEPSTNGNLVLGIGTQPNNMPPSGVVTYKTDEFGEIRTVFNGTNYNSIIDTGSNGLFFTSPSASMIPSCSQPNSEWFCPSSTTTLSAVNTDASGSTTGQVLFQIGNFTFLTGSGNNVFSDIGAALPNMFDWGLPFYFGRSVYVGIEGQASSLGTGHYFAY